MKCWFRSKQCALTLLGLSLSPVNVFAAAPGDSPTAEQIIQKTVERAQRIQAANRQANYSYTKSAVTEEFDSKGHLKEKREKVLQFEAGYGRLSTLKLNGR